MKPEEFDKLWENTFQNIWNRLEGCRIGLIAIMVAFFGIPAGGAAFLLKAGITADDENDEYGDVITEHKAEWDENFLLAPLGGAGGLVLLASANGLLVAGRESQYRKRVKSDQRRRELEERNAELERKLELV